MKKTSNRKNRMGLVLAGILLACSVSQGALVVYFSEDAGRVSIDMVGTISIDSSYVSVGSATASPGLYFDGDTALSIAGADHESRIKYSNAGVASSTGFGLTTSISTPNYGAMTGGFFQNSLYAVGDGVVDAGTRTYDFTGVHCDFGFAATLENIGADSFDNQLAWTANGTGDTITFVTGAVPEPATAGLMVGAGLVIAAYRRVRKTYGLK